MNLTDVLIVALVLCAAAAAGMYTWKHRNSCADCPGSCSRRHCSKNPQENPLVEQYRKDHPKDSR